MNPIVRKGAVGVFVIAALAAGRAITDAMPTDVGKMMGGADPFVVDAKAGEPATTRWAEVTVTDVRPALATGGRHARIETPAHLLLVDLKVKAAGEPRVLGGASLLAKDGRVFHADKRWLITNSIPTGLTWYATPVFEVPADAMQGAVLELGLGDDWWSQRRDDVLHVDLGITAAKAKQFAANKDVVPKPSSGFTPPTTTPLGQVSDAAAQ